MSPRPFANEAAPINPAVVVIVATLSDTVDLAFSGCLRADAAGTVVFIPEGNADASTITMSMAAGEVLPIRVRRVLATGTTIAAADLHILAY